jgi:hypothetical protein
LSIVVLLVYAAVVVAAVRRSKSFGAFALVIGAFPTFVGLALRGQFGALDPLVPAFQLAALVHFGSLIVWRNPRPAWFRALVSVPGLWFVASSLLAIPWAVAAALGFDPWVPWLPFGIGLAGVAQSIIAREETVDFVLDGRDLGELQRHREACRDGFRSERPLRIVQITDPHLGPFMSVARLRRICRRAVERQPDLILITGDLMTMESQAVDIVATALEPLSALPGRVFACLGNHDYEALPVVTEAYARTGVRLLVDEEHVAQTDAGPVQIVGMDFLWRERAAHLRSVCARFPRRGDALRVVLLHDPGAFRHLPEGEGDLVLSGHTHGGQVGLVSFGLPHTFLSAISSIPDHGPWARGRDRLYVHRAQGLYGFPIRLGVPAEQSLMQVHRRASF